MCPLEESLAFSSRASIVSHAWSISYVLFLFAFFFLCSKYLSSSPPSLSREAWETTKSVITGNFWDKIGWNRQHGTPGGGESCRPVDWKSTAAITLLQCHIKKERREDMHLLLFPSERLTG